MKREEELIEQGWEKRFIAEEPRLTEMAELYRSLGLEVLLEPLPSKEEAEAAGCEGEGCTVCFDANRDRYRTIYTRSRE